MIDAIARAATMDDLRTAARALDRIVMWSFCQIPDLYSATRELLVLEQVRPPGEVPPYFNTDTYHRIGDRPWPLWTWWDKSLPRRPTEMLAYILKRLR